MGLIDRFILSMRGIFEKVGITVYSYSEEKSTLYPKLRDFSQLSHIGVFEQSYPQSNMQE